MDLGSNSKLARCFAELLPRKAAFWEGVWETVECSNQLVLVGGTKSFV